MDEREVFEIESRDRSAPYRTDMSESEMEAKARKIRDQGFADVPINSEYSAGILQNGTTDRGYQEMNRAKGLNQPGYINDAGMADMRARQLGAVQGLGQRAMADPALAGMQNRAARANTLKAAMAQGGGPPGRAMGAYAGAGRVMADQAAGNTIQQRMGNASALGQAVGQMRGGDIGQGLQGRAHEQDWRQFQQDLSGSWRDKTREELVNRRAHALDQAGTAIDYNAKMRDIMLNSERSADQANWRAAGAATNAGGQLLGAAAKAWDGGGGGGSDGGGGGWWGGVSDKFK